MRFREISLVFSNEILTRERIERACLALVESIYAFENSIDAAYASKRRRVNTVLEVSGNSESEVGKSLRFESFE